MVVTGDGELGLFKLWNLTVPFKEITSACHCAIVIPTERSDEGSLFHYNRKYFVTTPFCY